MLSRITNKKLVNANISSFNNIANKLINVNEIDKKMGFWFIISKYKLDTLGIFNDINNPRLFYSITSVYKFLDKSDYFCIKYTLNRICNICQFSIILNEYYRPYITITLEEINNIKSLNEKIESLFYMEDCVCPKCGINLAEN